MNQPIHRVFLQGWQWSPHGDSQPFLPGSGRGSMWLWQLDAGTVVERPYRRGGMIRFLPAWYRGWQRAESELAVHESVFRAGLATVPPVGFAAEPIGLGFFRLSYFTQWVDDAVALPQWLRQGGSPDVKGLADLCAQMIRLGIHHPDLNLNNFCRSENRWLVLDFDRAKRIHDPNLAQLGHSVLMRMQRSFHKLALQNHVSSTVVLRFCVAFCRHLGLQTRVVLQELPHQSVGWLTRIRWSLSGGWRH